MDEQIYITNNRKYKYRKIRDRFFLGIFVLSIVVALVMLTTLLIYVLIDGAGWLSWNFISNYSSQLYPSRAGVLASLMGTVWIIVMTAAMCLPIGIATAIYLEEFATSGKFKYLIQLNIANLAGVPSIVYGLLGLVLFVQILFGGSRSVLAGAMTMTLLILPIVIISAQEALRAIPANRRDASYAIGATKWQTVRHVVLPEAIPGIMSGIILALSRAVGETAPILIISSLVFLQFVPSSPGDRFTVLPLQIYTWIAQPKDEFRHLASAGIIVLLCVLLLSNSAAIWVRSRGQKKYE